MQGLAVCGMRKKVVETLSPHPRQGGDPENVDSPSDHGDTLSVEKIDLKGT